MAEMWWSPVTRTLLQPSRCNARMTFWLFTAAVAVAGKQPVGVVEPLAAAL
jgi:hypothetical protein